ncbi:helix-turn-helix domain-containing protein [Bacillus tropicus]
MKNINMQESHILEFSTEVVRETGSFHTAVVLSAIQKIVGNSDGEITTEDIADFLKYDSAQPESVRRKLHVLECLGYIKYIKGTRYVKPIIEVLKPIEPDTDLDIRWMYQRRVSLRVCWMLSNLYNSGEILTTTEIKDLCEGLFEGQAASVMLSRLKKDGLVFHDPYSSKEDKRAGTWELSAEAIELYEDGI